MSNKKYVKVDQLLKSLNQRRPFSEVTQKLIQDQLMLQWTYNSNAIEGNTLTYKETSFYLLRGLTAKGKSLQEHLEVSNHRDAITFLEEILKNRKLQISEKLIREIHGILFKGITQIKIGWVGREHSLSIVAGSYKNQDNHVLKADGTIHYYTQSVAVPAEMKVLVSWIHKNWNIVHPIELAAKTHYELVRIHPFTDGNGRVARILMNLILMAKGFPPTVIKNEKKSEYYDSLERADRGDLRSFLKIVEYEVKETIQSLQMILDGKASPRPMRHVLYEIRKQRQLTQKQLSALSGVEQATISKIENRVEKPQMQTLALLAKVLKVDLQSLRSEDV